MIRVFNSTPDGVTAQEHAEKFTALLEADDYRPDCYQGSTPQGEDLLPEWLVVW